MSNLHETNPPKSTDGLDDIGFVTSFAETIREEDFPDFMTLEAVGRDQFLITHGVRHLVICGYFRGETEFELARMFAMLRYTPEWACGETCAKAIPFVIKSRSGGAMCGFASHPWIIDSLEWLQGVEHPHASRLEGLLLGYHPDAIEADENAFKGKRFPFSEGESSAK